MNNDRKNRWLVVVLLSMLSFYFWDNQLVKAEGLEEYVTEIDQDGNLLKGTEISSDRPIVRPAYQGNHLTIFDNVIGPKGYFSGFYDPTLTNHVATMKYRQEYEEGQNLIVKNLGQYDGRKIALKITFLGTYVNPTWGDKATASILNGGAVRIDLGPATPIQYQLVYDEPNYPVVQNIYLDLPNIFDIFSSNISKQIHPKVEISSDNLKKVFFSVPNSNWNQNIKRKYSIISKKISNNDIKFLQAEYETPQSLMANPSVSIVSNNDKPTVVVLTSVLAGRPYATIFKSDLQVPYIPNYLPVRANGEGNSDKLEAKYDITQAVIDAYPNYLPDSLKIVAEDTEGYFANLTPEAVTFTDKDGTKITDLISVAEAANGKLEMTLSKASLEKLKANQVNIKIAFDSLNLEKLLGNYNSTEKLYKVPLTFYNSRNVVGEEVESEKTKVEASISPNIYGEANSKQVVLGSSSDQLKATDLIKNGVTTIPDDTLKLTIIGSQIFDEFKEYTVNVKLESTKTPSLTKTVPVPVQVENKLEEGWEVGTGADFILNDGYKLEWGKKSLGNNMNQHSGWWYTYKDEPWVDNRKIIEASLIINGQRITSNNEHGFLWLNGDKSMFSINKSKKMLKRTFLYLDQYKIEIKQQLLDNNAAEVTYQVTNLTMENQDIGVVQIADIYVGVNYPLVTPVNDFKGLFATHKNSVTGETTSLSVIPDRETMPNWAAGEHYNISIDDFSMYSTQDALGVGWETGLRHRNTFAKLFNPPVKLVENVSTFVGNTGMTIKNGGVNVAPNQSESFKQTVKFGALSPPKVTLDQTEASLYPDDTLMLTGTISDEDNRDYRLYLEMDDKDKTLVPLEAFTNIEYNQVQNYRTSVRGSEFTVGEHVISVIGIDEYGTRSKGEKLKLTINELSGTPVIQKIKLGEQIPQTDLSTIVSDIRGVNVQLKTSLHIDSSKVGFQWVDAILIDRNLRELPIRLPVNVYNPDSTVFNDKAKLALDVPDARFELVNVREAEKNNSLNELVTQKIKPKAWNIIDGSDVETLLIENTIKPIFGNYSAIFEADNGMKLTRKSHLSVGGELKFSNLPTNIDFKKTKLGFKNKLVERLHPDWKIEIENTIGASWSLGVSATPFENKSKEQLKHGLIFKDKQNQEVFINTNNQKIALDTGEIYPVVQWKETEGLLLDLNPAAKIGVYQGEVTWELTDAP